MVKNNTELLAQVRRILAGTCVDCNRPMTAGTGNWELTLDIWGQEHTLVITDVPVTKCECGEEFHDLDLEIRVDEMVDRLVTDSLRYQKDVPDRMSIEELLKVKSESSEMKMIRDVRDKHYEETKGMDNKQLLEFYRKKSVTTP